MHKKVKVFKNIQNKYGKVRLKQNRKKQKAQKENNSYRRQRRFNTLITEFSKEKQNNTQNQD